MKTGFRKTGLQRTHAERILSTDVHPAKKRYKHIRILAGWFSHEGRSALSLHFFVFITSIYKQGDVRIGVFPKRKKCLIGVPSGGRVPAQNIRARQTKISGRVKRRTWRPAAMVR